MKLSNVKLVGFRSHHSTEVLLENYTCIIGRNDCGKSAFLRAIRLLLDPRVNPVAEDLTTLEPAQTQAYVEAEFVDVPDTWPIGVNGNLKLRRGIVGASFQWEAMGMVPVEPELKRMSIGQGAKGVIEKSATISAEIKAALGEMPGGTLKAENWLSLYQTIEGRGLVDKAFCDIIDSSFLDEHFGDGHSVFSESSSFIRADVVSSTHGLAGLQISD